MNISNLLGSRAELALKRTSRGKFSSSSKVSTGKRVNTAKDDSAGLAISQKMKSQIRGLNQANRNTADGMSLVNSMDGGMSSIADMLHRQRELTIQSMNDGALTESDRDKIQTEVNQLTKEITSMARNLNFNDKYPLNRMYIGEEDLFMKFSDNINSVYNSNGSFKMTMLNEVGDFKNPFSKEEMILTLDDNIKIDLFNFKNNQGNGTLKFNGIKEDASGYRADWRYTHEVDGKNYNVYVRKTVNIDNDGNANVAFRLHNYSYRDVKYNLEMNYEVGGAGYDGSNVYNDSRGDMGISFDSNNLNKHHDNSSIRFSTSGTFRHAVVRTTHMSTNFYDARSNEEKDINRGDSISLQVGARTGDLITFPTYDCTASALGVNSLSIDTLGAATRALEQLDQALDKINSYRADVGSLYNRLSNNLNFLEKSSINLESSKSKIEDADVAKEMMGIMRTNVIQQSGMTMLSQSNGMFPEQVNRLLSQ